MKCCKKCKLRNLIRNMFHLTRWYKNNLYSYTKKCSIIFRLNKTEKCLRNTLKNMKCIGISRVDFFISYLVFIEYNFINLK